MPIDIKYNGESIASLENGTKAKLSCAGKRMLTDLEITAPAYVDVDNLPITLDFTSGADQSIDIPDNTIVKSLTITKPADLLPENIKQGKTIAGVAGTHLGGSEPEIKVLFETATIGSFEDTGNTHPTTNAAIYGLETEPSPVSLEKGETYIIDWDGTQYTVVCKEASINGASGTYLCLGDGAMVSPMGASAEASSEPFVILYGIYNGSSMAMIATTDSGETHDIGVSLVSESGISDSRIHYVTFMHEGVEIYKMPVVNTDTCHDPVEKGYISAPTKESTEQYTYAYTGWSLTDDNTVDSSALTNVTEDRTVYAAMTESLRYYTVTYYDDDRVTVLKTLSVAYGEVPSYIPSKDNHMFMGWDTEEVAVTGDANYYASWEASYTFADASWEYISDISNRGLASQAFSLGDTKVITLTNDAKLELRIIGFNHDTKSDGTKAGITIATSTVFPDITTIWAGDSWGADSSIGASDSRVDYNQAKCRVSYLISTGSCISRLPTDLREVIQPVSKDYRVGTNVVTSYEKLWAFSITELGLTTGTDALVEDPVLGSKYEYFTTAAKSRCKSAYGSSDYSTYWLRSLGYNSGYRGPRYRTTDDYTSAAIGYIATNYFTTKAHSIAFGFCI